MSFPQKYMKWEKNNAKCAQHNLCSISSVWYKFWFLQKAYAFFIYLFIYFPLLRFSHLAETFSNTNLLVPTRVFLSFVDMQDFYEYSFL